MSAKRDKNPQGKRLMVYFREYCDYTGIHGFKYIGENRTLTERIWWTVWLLLSVIFCGMMVFQIFDKYINYPVLITFSMKETRLQQIPFPAVTICPRAKFSLSHFNVSSVYEKMFGDNFTEEEAEKIGYASAICEFSHLKPVNYTQEGFYQFLNEAEQALHIQILFVSGQRTRM
nr:unnamed protein product [Callosobruchus chinensis]